MKYVKVLAFVTPFRVEIVFFSMMEICTRGFHDTIRTVFYAMETFLQRARGAKIINCVVH